MARIPVARSCPVVGPVGRFNFVILMFPIPCVLPGKEMFFLATLRRVDKIWGNNDTATLNGAPFLTIGPHWQLPRPAMWCGSGRAPINETINYSCRCIVTGISHCRGDYPSNGCYASNRFGGPLAKEPCCNKLRCSCLRISMCKCAGWCIPERYPTVAQRCINVNIFH